MRKNPTISVHLNAYQKLQYFPWSWTTLFISPSILSPSSKWVFNYFQIPFFLSLNPSPTRASWSKLLIKKKFSNQVFSLVLWIWLSCICPLFPFYTPWKHRKPFGFLVLSGDIKWEYWPEMSWYKQVPTHAISVCNF